MKQIKKDRSVVRAFGTYWSGSDSEILLVVAVYKKSDEREFWARRDQFETTVRDYLNTLNQLDERGQVAEWISRAKESDDYLVYESC